MMMMMIIIIIIIIIIRDIHAPSQHCALNY